MSFCQAKRLDTTAASTVGFDVVEGALLETSLNSLPAERSSRSLSRGPASFRCKAELGVCGVREGPRRLVKLTSGVLFLVGRKGPKPLWERALQRRRRPQRPIPYSPVELGSPPPPPAPGPQSRYTPPHGHLGLPPLRQGASTKHVGRPPTDDEGASSRASGPNSRGAAGPTRDGHQRRRCARCGAWCSAPYGDTSPRAPRAARSAPLRFGTASIVGSHGKDGPWQLQQADEAATRTADVEHHLRRGHRRCRCHRVLASVGSTSATLNVGAL